MPHVPPADVPRTIALLPFYAGGRYPKPILVGRCQGERLDAIPGSELVDRVRDIGLGLRTLGLTRGARVALLSESRPEWLFTDFAVLAAGAVTTPIYPTLAVEQVAYILRDCEASMAIVSTPTQLAKTLQACASLPALRTIVVIDPPADGLPACDGRTLVSFADVVARGHAQITGGWGVAREFQDEARAVQPGDLATIIYTSGTTAEPKGVMLTHANLVANIDGVLQVLDLNERDTALSFLPLCHGFERMVAYVYMAAGVGMVFAESLETVARDLLTVTPTVMTGVPRVFEKLQARVLEKGREAGGLKRAIFDWAVRLADVRGRVLPGGGSLSPWQALQSRLAERLVYHKVRERVGGRLRFAVSGSAPLPAALARFFYGMGLPLLEGYGLTETAPVLCVMPLDAVRFGTVGPPLPNVEIRIAPDGEILARGPNIMQGYYKRPEDTAQVLRDGWFHTGDIGKLDERGYLCITDRKKEFIATSGGKKIAPQPIENTLRAHALITEAVLIGEGRNFPSALIVPDCGALSAAVGAPKPMGLDDKRTLVARADARAAIQAVITELNAHLAQFERIKQFTLLPQEFSLETGELTPTLKIKRRVIEEKYRREIDAMYHASL
jgi:long-chain acyl-CoA synthetase